MFRIYAPRTSNTRQNRTKGVEVVCAAKEAQSRRKIKAGPRAAEGLGQPSVGSWRESVAKVVNLVSSSAAEAGRKRGAVLGQPRAIPGAEGGVGSSGHPLPSPGCSPKTLPLLAVADFLYFPGKPEWVPPARGKVKPEGRKQPAAL